MKSCDFVAHLVICVILVMWLWTGVVFPLQLILWSGSYCTHPHCFFPASASTSTSALSAIVSLVKTVSVIFLYIFIQFFAAIPMRWAEAICLHWLLLPKTFQTQLMVWTQVNQSTTTLDVRVILSLAPDLRHFLRGGIFADTASGVFCLKKKVLHTFVILHLFLKKKKAPVSPSLILLSPVRTGSIC